MTTEDQVKGVGRSAPEPRPAAFRVPDYDLISPIAAGAYGEVWLARNAIGTLRAVKVVRRDWHKSSQSFEREFRGLQKFEPVSRAHQGLVDILTLGLFCDGAGFYYVMELADNATAEIPSRTAETAPVTDYTPKTLRAELEHRGALPAKEVISLGVKLSEALAHLHSHGLVHRDIKPSNIIFVRGEPKLADIGLVTDTSDSCSIVGTEGYLPPEGPGSPQGDVYALDRVLYEAASGRDRRDYPALPEDLRSRSDAPLLAELNAINLKACAPELNHRYRNADELRADFEKLRAGKSIRSARRLEARWRTIRHTAPWLGAAAVIFLFFFSKKASSSPESTAGPQRSVNAAANDEFDQGVRLDRWAGDSEAAIPHFREAIRLDPEFALAQSWLASSLAWGHEMPLAYDQHPHMDEAVQTAKSALARDTHLSRAHMVLGWHAFVRRHDWRAAKEHFEKAILYQPNDWEPHEWYGLVLSAIGEHSKAIAQMEAATRLGGSEPDANAFYGKALFAARRYADAADKYRKAIKISKAKNGWLHLQLATVFLWQNRESDSAIANWADAMYGAKESWVIEMKQALREGRPAFWRKRLESIRLRSDDPLILADAAAGAGETAAALGYLETAQMNHHDFLVLRLKNDPEWDSLRAEPRFKKLLIELNLAN